MLLVVAGVQALAAVAKMVKFLVVMPRTEYSSNK
jgi:hypothetical protein